MHIVFKTDRFIVREHIPADADQFVTMLTDPIVKVHLPQHSPAKWTEIFNANLKYYKEKPGFGRWAVVDKSANLLMGNCMLMPGREGLSGFEVGYAFEQAYWGTGAGTEIVQGLVNYAFALPGVHLLYAVTNPENTASRRVLKNAAFGDKGLVDFLGLQLSFYQLAK